MLLAMMARMAARCEVEGISLSTMMSPRMTFIGSIPLATARRAGFKVIHVPRAKGWHKIPLDERDSSPLVHYYMTRNRLLFLKATGASWRVWGHVLLTEYLRTLISWSVRTRWQHKRPHRNAMIQAIADAGRGRWSE